jgi:hypothetical protein
MGWTKGKGGGVIKNLSLIKECFNLMQEFGPLVKMSWTKGHSTGISFEAKGNRQADEAANKVLDEYVCFFSFDITCLSLVPFLAKLYI